MVAVLLLWYSTSTGRELYYFPYLPLIFLGLTLLFRGRLGEWIHAQYSEIVGFRGAGIQLMIIGMLLIVGAQIAVFAAVREAIAAGLASLAVAVIFLLAFFLKENDVFKKISGLIFLVGGVVLLLGMAHSGFYMSLTAVLVLITLFFLVLILYGYKTFTSFFLFSFMAFGIAAGILMVNTAASIPADAVFHAILASRYAATPKRTSQTALLAFFSLTSGIVPSKSRAVFRLSMCTIKGAI